MKNEHYIAPTSLLKLVNIKRPEDIDIVSIARFCGADVEFEELQGCEAQIMGSKDKAIITVNSEVRCERKRFSIAHELGHWMWDRGDIGKGCSKDEISNSWNKMGKENRADRYAAELLLPEFLFKDSCRNRGITINTLLKIAKEYRTSMAATAIRLVELGSYPAIVISSSSGKIKWYGKSPDLPNDLYVKEYIPEGTQTYKLLNSPNSRRSDPAYVPASKWINYKWIERYEATEESIAGYKNEILTLLWFERSAPLTN